VALDVNGNQVNDEVLEQAFQEFNNRGFEGKLQSKLAERIRKGGGESIRVIFQLRSEAGEPFQGKTDTERQAYLERVSARISTNQRQFVEQVKGGKHQVVYQSLYTPMVVVLLPVQAVEALSRRGDVERVYEEGKGAVRLNTSRVVVQGDIVSSRGYTGTAQYVGVVEPDRIGTHPNLPSNQRTLCQPTASTTASNHKTFVAGVIQSTDIARRGIAPSVTIVDGVMATNSDSEVMTATDCVINTAAATNLSYGNETNGNFDALARYFDSLVYNTGASVAVAASNNCNSRVGSPEIAFNVIGVGSFDDKNTTSFSDDTASCIAPMTHGAFQNPISPNNDREEPDVVAPGQNITSTLNSGGFGPDNGNSFAAPHVAAGIALLRSRKTALFTFAAEVRAIMLASARHNIEGSSRLSDRDGAGAIMLAAADTVVANSQSEYIFVDGATSNFPITRTFTASNGQKVRVVISWDHKMPLGNAMTQPTTDLDLQVRCGNTLIGTSASRDNNYEIVEFTATTCSSGYTARIINTRSSARLEQIGYAVSKTDS
jgi:subtilisin family serine protease